MIAARVPLHMHGKLDSLYNVWFYFWRTRNWEDRDGRSMTVEKDADPRRQPSSSAPSSSGSAHITNDGNDMEDDDKSHGTLEDNHVPSFFTRLVVGSLYQPLDSVEQYFGENVAFYFAWLQHSAFHLAFLSVFGIIVFMCQIISGVWDHWIRPVFAMVVMLWSFIVMVNWRKRSNFLAHRWGTMNYKEQETTRPQFKGKYRKDEITGEWVVYYPSWKRWLKYLISFPITLAFTVGTLVLILLVHANRDQLLVRYMTSLSASGSSGFNIDFSVKSIGKPMPVNSVEITGEHLKDPTFWFLTAGLPALLGLCLPLLNFILMRVSIALNDFENYRTESEYRTHLIIKVFSFRFVCYFATLYYYAFLSTGSDKAIENGILRVGTGVFIYITVSHWWGVFLQIFFPLSIRKVRLYFQKKQLREELKQIELEESELEASSTSEDDEDAKEKRTSLVNRRLLLDQGQDEIWEEIMLPMHDSFPEYIQAVILFAYVTCFSVVLPITPFVCLINSLLSMRLDAYKVCRGRRRPLAHKTGGIGVWEHVLHIVTVIAVLTNCWLMGFTNEAISSLATSISTLGLFAIVVGWEHIMLLIKYVMQTSISHLPKSVREEIQREEVRIARKRNSNLRRKNGRRSKLNRETSRLSSLLASEDRSYLSSKSKRFSTSRPPSSSKGAVPPNSGDRGLSSSRPSSSSRGSVPPNSGDRDLHTIASSSADSESSSPVERTRQPPRSGRKFFKKGGVAATSQSMSRMESPFESYPSFQTPPPVAQRDLPNRSMSGLLGKGLDSNTSLATSENEESDTFSERERRRKELDDAEDVAAARISSRLSRLEDKVRSRYHAK